MIKIVVIPSRRHVLRPYKSRISEIFHYSSSRRSVEQKWYFIDTTVAQSGFVIDVDFSESICWLSGGSLTINQKRARSKYARILICCAF